MERLTKRIDLGNGKYTIDFSNERCGEFLTNHKAGVKALFEKLAEYEDAEEQGLLVRLPCNVGDMVYEIASYCFDCQKQTDWCHYDCKEPTYRIRKFAVNYFEINNKNIVIHGRSGYAGILGKTVFLTREEAEKALAEMEK